MHHCACRYGTVPVGRKTGGLNDTVFDVDDDEERASSQGMVTNGYNFEGTDAGGVDYALNRALAAWNNDKQASMFIDASTPVVMSPSGLANYPIIKGVFRSILPDQHKKSHSAWSCPPGYCLTCSQQLRLLTKPRPM